MYFKSVNRGLSFTVLGRYLVAMTLGVGTIAVLTGVNGMFLFLGLSLGMFTVSGLISEKNIKSLLIHLQSTPQFFDTGKKGVLHFSVENGTKIHSLYAVEAKIYLGPPKYGLFRSNRKPQSHKFITSIEPLSKITTEAYFEAQERGFFEELTIQQSTTFPFGIFLKFKYETVPAKIYILPRERPELRNMWSLILASLVRPQVGNDDFIGHQIYNDMTPFKLIDWKKNAGREPSQWVVKSFRSQEYHRAICLCVSPGYIESLSHSEFESLLGNLRTGLELISPIGFKVSLDLGSNGVSSSYTSSLVLLSKATCGQAIPSGKEAPDGIRVTCSIDHAKVEHDRT